MGDFNRRNQSSNNRSFDKPRFRSERPDMHKATCASCGKICEVPFRPTSGKPVFCKDCFKSNGGAESSSFENRDFGRQIQRDRQMYEAVCANCGNSCQIPFRPTPGREVFCSRCFENKEGSDVRREERKSPSFNRNESPVKVPDAPIYVAQFQSLNAKLDKILRLLTEKQVVSMPMESVIDKEVIEEIAEEVQDAKKVVVEKKEKVAKVVSEKPAAKSKKSAPKKK